MTTGAPSFTKATRLFVVPKSMPTTLSMFTPGAPAPWRRRHLPFDAGQEVADVVALEHALAQGLEHRRAPGRGGAAIDRLVPLRRQRQKLRLVRGSLLFDRPA